MDLNVTSTTYEIINFSYRKPYKCYENYSVKCIDILNHNDDIFINASLNEKTLTGYCPNLISGRPYVISATVANKKYSNTIRYGMDEEIYTALRKFENFKLNKDYERERLRATFEFVNKGWCREFQLCTKNIARQICEPLIPSNSKCFINNNFAEAKSCNCQFLGNISLVIIFENFREEFVHYGKMQVFYIETLGMQEGKTVNSDTDERKMELDRVRLTSQLHIYTSLSDSLAFELKPENLPRGAYDTIQISCHDEDDPKHIDTYENCTRKGTDFSCVCTELLAGSSYKVKFRTYKKDWDSVELILGPPYNTSRFQGALLSTFVMLNFTFFVNKTFFSFFRIIFY